MIDPCLNTKLMNVASERDTGLRASRVSLSIPGSLPQHFTSRRGVGYFRLRILYGTPSHEYLCVPMCPSSRTSLAGRIRYSFGGIPSSSVMDIFSLPRVVRNDIYQGVLALGHPIYLFQYTGSSAVAIFAPDRPVHWLALLYTNQKVYSEARAVLYGLNHFGFVDTARCQASLVQCFLQRIGPVNAGHLSHVSINFPVVEGLGRVESHGEDSGLGKDDVLSLHLLLEECTNLTTLEMRLYGEKTPRI